MPIIPISFCSQGLVDLYPTILDLAGLAENPENSGQSLVPILEGKESEQRSITTEYGKDNFAVVDEHYRYIRYANGDEELYDLRNDPNEWTNVAGDAKYASIKTALANDIPPNTRRRVEGEMYK